MQPAMAASHCGQSKPCHRYGETCSSLSDFSDRPHRQRAGERTGSTQNSDGGGDVCPRDILCHRKVGRDPDAEPDVDPDQHTYGLVKKRKIGDTGAEQERHRGEEEHSAPCGQHRVTAADQDENHRAAKQVA